MTSVNECEEALARDPLGKRLSRIEAPAMSPELWPRVLAGGHTMKLGRRRRLRAAALMAAGLAAAVALVAATPMTRGYVADLFQQMGVAQAPGGLASSTGYGHTLWVTGGIDDGQIVMIDLHTSPDLWGRPIGKAEIGNPITITDATGHQLQVAGWQESAPGPTGEAMIMARRPAAGAPPGTPLTLHVTASQQAGSWTLRFTIPGSGSLAREQVPTKGTIRGVTVTFTRVQANHHYIVVTADVRGPDVRSVMNVTGPTSLTDPGGQHVPNVWSDGPISSGPDGAIAQVQWYWPRHGTGTYHLTVGANARGGPSLTRDLPIS